MHAEESGAITSLPILFENLVVEVLLTLKEVVIETHHGETEVCECGWLAGWVGGRERERSK